jgi:hypothetical protein
MSTAKKTAKRNSKPKTTKPLKPSPQRQEWRQNEAMAVIKRVRESRRYINCSIRTVPRLPGYSGSSFN